MRVFFVSVMLFLICVPQGILRANIISTDTTGKINPYSISGAYHHGFVLPHHKTIPFYTIDPINGIELYYSRFFPNIDPKRPPEIGWGYYHSNMGNLEVYGRVHGFYMGLGSNFFKSRSRIYLQQTFCFGISYITEHFDIDENYSNRLIGSTFNAFITYSLNLRARISNNVVIYAGPVFSHMSNGNMKMPNFGLNQVTTKIGLSYLVKPAQVNNVKEFPGSENDLKDRMLILFSGGSRQASRRIDENFFAGSMVLDYTRRVNHFQALGAGLDLIFDAAEGRELYVSGDRIEDFVPWHIGMHLSWERIWNRLSIALQPGYKVLTFSEHRSYQYNRASIRYRNNYNMVFACSIKAHGVRADFIEFGIGYQFEK